MVKTDSKDHIFTGQKIAKHQENFDISVNCAQCKKQIGLRMVYPDDTGLAWFDPYLGNGKYVHFECLSRTRRLEIEVEEGRKSNVK